MRELPTLGYDEFDSFFLMKGTPWVEGNAGAGSQNVGFNLGFWNNSRFTNNSGHGVEAVGVSTRGALVQPMMDLTLWKVNIALWGYIGSGASPHRVRRPADPPSGFSSESVLPTPFFVAENATAADNPVFRNVRLADFRWT